MRLNPDAEDGGSGFWLRSGWLRRVVLIAGSGVVAKTEGTVSVTQVILQEQTEVPDKRKQTLNGIGTYAFNRPFLVMSFSKAHVAGDREEIVCGKELRDVL